MMDYIKKWYWVLLPLLALFLFILFSLVSKDVEDPEPYEIRTDQMNEELLNRVNELRTRLAVEPLFYAEALQEDAGNYLDSGNLDIESYAYEAIVVGLDYEPVESGFIEIEEYLADSIYTEYSRDHGVFERMVDPHVTEFATASGYTDSGDIQNVLLLK